METILVTMQYENNQINTSPVPNHNENDPHPSPDVKMGKNLNSLLKIVKKYPKGLIFLGIMTIAVVLGTLLAVRNNTDPRSKASVSENLSPYACDPNDPPLKLIQQSFPGKITPDSDISVTIEVANCSGATFKPNTHKLSLSNGSDWQQAEINFASEVPHNNTVLLSAIIKSPSQVGSYVLGWQLTINQEQISPPLTPDLILVMDDYFTCASANLVKNTPEDASKAINDCIREATNNSIIGLEPGDYILKNPIKLLDSNKKITITTKNSEELRTPCLVTENKKCAKLVADPNLPTFGNPSEESNMAMLKFSDVNQVTLSHLIFDGNQKNRNRECSETLGGQRQNMVVQSDNAKIFYNAIVNAKCGTGISLGGHNNYLVKNYIGNNGYHPSNWILSDTIHTVADGASIVGSNATIMNNIFRNNTDVDLILWGSTGSKIHFNQVIHDNANYATNAGIMTSTDSVPGNTAIEDSLGNHQNTNISYNQIDCPQKLCGYGIQLGLKSWSPAYPPVTGGNITNNIINGGIVGINIDGSGTTDHPTKIGYNKIINSGGVVSNMCSYPITQDINQAPGDVVIYLDGSKADTSFAWDCKSASCYFDSNYCSTANTCAQHTYSEWGGCVNNIQTRTLLKNPSCLGGNDVPTIYKSCLAVGKTIKGAAFCIDRSMPVNTGQVRGLENVSILAQFDNAPHTTLMTNEVGYFNLENVSSNFSLIIVDLSQSMDRGNVFGGVKDINETYVVANAQAAQANCDNITSGNKASGMNFLNCKINPIPEISDGFAFVLGNCLDESTTVPSPTPTLSPKPTAVPSPTLKPTTAPTPTPKPYEATYSKTIKGAVYCYDYSLPPETGFVKGMHNAKLKLTDQNNKSYITYSNSSGIFSFNKKLTSTFNLDISGLPGHGEPFTPPANSYVVANAQASNASCTIDRVNNPLSFLSCQSSLLETVSDGFAFIVGPCN